MKTNKQQILFKKLIKECIREVIREELPQIINETLSKNNRGIMPHQDFIKDFTPNYKEFLPKDKTIKPNIVSPQLNPLEKILKQTAVSMTTEDMRNMTQGNIVNQPVIAQNGALAQNFNIGEIEEWTPSNMKDFNFPI